MELTIIRTYYPAAVNGKLYCNGIFQCFTIELPWLNNKQQQSCIPEGTYRLKKRWSPRHSWHLQVTGVPGRSFILLHPANDAQRQLRGCIAPVQQLTGIGKGSESGKACRDLLALVSEAMKTEPIYVTIKNKKS